jgi:hypothetical protein
VIPSLHESCYNAVDYAISETGAHLRRVKHFTKERQGEALTHFVLLLNDQQVLAGLAVLIQAIANSFYVTRYELLLVVSLT